MSRGHGLPTYAQRIEAFRRTLLEHALARYRGNRTLAAKSLGLQRTYFCRLLRARGITYAAAPMIPPAARLGGRS